MPAALRPHHLFSHRERAVLLDIEGMRGHLLDADLADRLRDAPGDLDGPTMAWLAERGLTDALPGPCPDPTPDLPPVSNAVLFLTQCCNLRCRYCYGDRGRYGEAGRMSVATARRAVSWLLDRSGPVTTVQIGFLGGEPLLDLPLLRAVTLFAESEAERRGKRAEFYLTTNGTLLDADAIAFLRAHRVKVQVSLDGPGAVHDRQRPFANGKGSHARIAANAARLLDALPNSGAHATLVGDTDPGQVVAALLDLGFREVSILPATRPGTPARDTDALAAWLEDGAEAWLARARARDVEALRRLVSSTSLYAAIVSLLDHARNHYPCGAGLGMVAISCTGDIYPCQRFVGMTEFRMATLGQERLERGLFQLSPATTQAACADCFARYYCAGGCRHDHLVSAGAIDRPAADMCRIRRRQLELAAYVVGQWDAADLDFLRGAAILPAPPCPLDFL